MAKYINADEMMADETEAYLSAVAKIDKLNADIAYVVHKKIQMLLADAPAEDVAPVIHGKWMGTVCTACGTSWGDIDEVGDFSYCPICGAKMDGDDNG